MKSLSLNVPDEQAQAFAKELATLMKKHGVEVENKEALDAMRPITERVKTFEDACNELGEENVLVQAYRTAEFNTSGNQNDVSDVVAYLKLRIIVAALNEGWQPTFSDDEYRYYPWFVFYTKEELDAMDEEERSRVLGRSSNNANAYAGVAYSSTNSASSLSVTFYGGRLCFKNRELAEYAGQQFLAIYADFLIGF